MIDNAEAELTNELKHKAGDAPLPRQRGWNFGTARLQVFNDEKERGLDHRSMLQFLWGLRLSGMEYGFWGCGIEFYDSDYTVSRRGLGLLRLAPAPR